MIYYTNPERSIVYAIQDESELAFLPWNVIAITHQEKDVIIANNLPPLDRNEEHNRATERINAWRDQQEAGTISFEHAGRFWDCSLITADRMRPLVSADTLPAGFYWTDAYNDDVTMGREVFMALAKAHGDALAEHGFAIHQQQRGMKKSLQGMTAEQLAAFVPGW